MGESAPYQTVWDEGVQLDYVFAQLTEADRTDALEATDVLTVLPIRSTRSPACSRPGRASTWRASRCIPNNWLRSSPHCPADFSERGFTEYFEAFVEALLAVVRRARGRRGRRALVASTSVAGAHPCRSDIGVAPGAIHEGLGAIAAHL